MKKLTAILLIVLYSSLNIVSAINLHYCHGNLVDYSINKPVKPCCDTDLQIKATCCSNVSIDIDLDKNQLVQPSLEIDSVKILSVLYSLINSYTVAETSSSQRINIIVADSPPGESCSEIYLLNNSFLFYG